MFASPLALFALLSVPVVLAIHLLRRRFRPREVSALFLWVEQERDPSEGRRWERLRATTSLILELLAAALLSLALAGPRGCEDRGVHHVWVLDGSASMTAPGPDGEAADRRAVSLLQERLDDLPARDRISLLESGPHPRVLAGPEAMAEEARAALGRWTPGGPDADPADTLSLARALSGGGGLLWVTDRAPPEDEVLPADLELLALGAPRDNVGFVEAARGAGESTLTLASFSSQTAEGRILVEGAAPLPFSLAPGARQRLRLETGAAGVLKASLAQADGRPWQDGLALDDRVQLAPPPSRHLRLGSALPAAMNRALGLQDGPADASGVGRWVAAVPDSEGVAAGQADLLLTLGDAPPVGARALQLNAPPAPEAGRAERSLLGPFLATGHPLLAGWSGEGLIWTPGLAITVGPEDQPLLIAGDRPLLVARGGDVEPRFVMDIDPWRSTLARSADWALLLTRLAELRRAELPGPQQTNLRVGEELVWSGAGQGEARLDSEAEQRVVQARGDLAVGDLRVGLYRVTPPTGAAQDVAFNLGSEAESELRGRGAASREASAEGSELIRSGSGAAAALGLVALALLLVDWTLLNRRRT